jgi:hypothetical protein
MQTRPWQSVQEQEDGGANGRGTRHGAEPQDHEGTYFMMYICCYRCKICSMEDIVALYTHHVRVYTLQIDPSRDLIYVLGAVPGNNGGFLRVVDAVKGPFAPVPLPLPTFQGSPASAPLYAPLSAEDAGLYKEVENPY